MEIHHGGVGRVPLKSTGPSAPIRELPQHCRPQNQWAPDDQVNKWEQEIKDIFQHGDEHKFEEAEILSDSKDFPTHSGIQTPALTEAFGKPKEFNERREETQRDAPPPLNREEFPSLGTDLNELPQKGEQLFGNSRVEEHVEMPRHGVPLEEFIDQSKTGDEQHQNIEGKVAERRSETAPDSGVHMGKELKKEVTKKQGEPDLSPPAEQDKEKEEMKEVHSVVEDVKHVIGAVGEKLAAGAHEVKEMLTDAVHHLTATTEADDSTHNKATDETGYNTCA